MAIERRYERDIDILPAEEFAVSPTFAVWILKQTRYSAFPAKVLDAHVWRTGATRRSDQAVVGKSAAIRLPGRWFPGF